MRACDVDVRELSRADQEEVSVGQVLNSQESFVWKMTGE
jgi:hypothetical protein